MKFGLVVAAGLALVNSDFYNQAVTKVAPRAPGFGMDDLIDAAVIAGLIIWSKNIL